MKKLLLFSLCAVKLILGTDYFLPTQYASSALEIATGIKGFGTSSNQLFENPAGLYRMEELSISGFYNNLYGDFNYQNIAFGMRYKKLTVSFGFMQLFVPNIPTTILAINTDYNEEEIMRSGAYDYQNNVYKLGIHKSITSILEIGIALNHYKTSIYTLEGSGNNLDIGLILHPSIIEVSIYIENIIPNTSVKFNDGKDVEDIPQNVYLGLKKDFNQFNIYTQLKMNPNYTLKSIGTSYTPSFLNHLFELHCSFSEQYSIKKSSTINTGVSLNLFGTHFEYAYRKSDYELDSSMHFFSFGIDLKRRTK